MYLDPLREEIQQALEGEVNYNVAVPVVGDYIIDVDDIEFMHSVVSKAAIIIGGLMLYIAL